MSANAKPWTIVMAEIEETFRKWKIHTWTIAPRKAPERRDRYHTQSVRTVQVIFRYRGRPVTLTVNTLDRAHDNLQLLAVTLETLRLSDVRKVTDLVAAAYAQMVSPAKPPTTPPPIHGADQDALTDPYRVLGVERHYPMAIIEAIWKARLRVEHPDVGGSAATAARLNAAMDELRKAK
jgi:hypothetical protein